VKERPILFSGSLVQAILAGHKTQTRRVMKTQPTSPAAIFDVAGGLPVWAIWPSEELDDAGHPKDHGIKCPYGRPGDRLWVREAWRLENDTGPNGLTVSKYVAADSQDHWRVAPNEFLQSYKGELRNRVNSPIHMPRWASRITLEITAVRVERLQAISEADAMAEGAKSFPNGGYVFNGTGYDKAKLCHSSPEIAFARAWDEINGGKSHPWESNPWVWVVEFRKVVSS
jgi:hypothetical protein